jgi:glutaredoxin 3
MINVTMYTTHHCGYCRLAEEFLRQKGVTDILKIWIDEAPDMREKMIAQTGRRSVPQIFINETHIGGYTDLVALDRQGALDPLLASTNP